MRCGQEDGSRRHAGPFQFCSNLWVHSGSLGTHWVVLNRDMITFACYKITLTTVRVKLALVMTLMGDTHQSRTRLINELRGISCGCRSSKPSPLLRERRSRAGRWEMKGKGNHCSTPIHFSLAAVVESARKSNILQAKERKRTQICNCDFNAY